MTKEEKAKQMKLTTDRINKSYQKSSGNDRSIVMSPDDPSLQIDRVPCGIHAVDDVLEGGFIKGAIHCIHGAEGAGKTSLCLQLAAEITQREEYVLYVNMEPPFPIDMLDTLGVNKEYFKLITARDYGEEVVDVVESYLYDREKRMAKDLVSLVVIDSLNNFVSKREVDKLEKDGSEGEMVAARALLIDKLLRRLQGRYMLEHGCIVIVIVQDRANMDANSHVKYQLSAGYSVRYNPKIRLYLGKKLLPMKLVNGVKSSPGHTIVVKGEKNNIVEGPLKENEYTVMRGIGVDDSERVSLDGQDLGWVYADSDIGKAFYRFLVGDPNLVVKGKASIVKALRAHPTLLTELRRALKSPTAKTPPKPTAEYLLYDPDADPAADEQSATEEA